MRRMAEPRREQGLPGSAKKRLTCHKETTMQRKPLIAALLAAAFAFPLAANAGGADKPAGAKTAAAANGANDGGAEAMFTSLDKNGDGFISKEEATGTPHAGDFASLDKNGDGKLSREEHANAKEHVAARANAGSTGSSTSSSSDKPSGTTKY
jgi:EF hand domain-containing protein